MEGLFSLIVYVVVIMAVASYVKKKKTAATSGKAVRPANRMSGTAPQRYKESGAMPHKHEKGHYTSMADASKLPPGYILLNGEPVRVADLEGK